jgi:hypothetical protein
MGEPAVPVCGLDYPFTFSRTIRGLGAARLVSTPSRHLGARLGSGLPVSEVSPILSSSASPVSLASTQVLLKSAASAIPPRPRGLTAVSMIGQVGVDLHARVSISGWAICSPVGKIEDPARGLLSARARCELGGGELIAECRQSAAGIVHGIVGAGCILAYDGVFD